MAATTTTTTTTIEEQQQHYKAISLFAGCGGSALGYKLAGFNILLANEFIDSARAVFALNFPEAVVLQQDIRNISAEQILDSTNLRKGDLDLLDGSPPCSSFSTTGIRQRGWNLVKPYSDGVEQRTDDLHYEFTRLLKGLQPKVFVCENVPALTQGLARGFFNEMFRDMQQAGYNLKASIMNCKHYDVAQDRNRLFFIGIRKDLNLVPSFPKPSSANHLVTVGQAMRGVQNEDWELKEAANIGGRIKYWIVRLKPGERGSDIHPRGSYWNLQRLSFYEICPTITAIGSFNRTEHKRSGLCHPLENRYVTISELKRLSSFPDEFKLTGNFIQQWERIARSVPPNMMKAIALHIKENILGKLN